MFAEKGDRLLFGARSLVGPNLAVDSRKKKLVAAGPLPVATTFKGSACFPLQATLEIIFPIRGSGDTSEKEA